MLFPQMSNILLLKSVLLAQPQISNKIMCPYYPYVVLYKKQTNVGFTFKKCMRKKKIGAIILLQI